MKTIMIVKTTCPICDQEHRLAADGDEYMTWLEGTPVQLAFPKMTVEDRERLQSGTCPECWNKMFEG